MKPIIMLFTIVCISCACSPARIGHHPLLKMNATTTLFIKGIIVDAKTNRCKCDVKRPRERHDFYCDDSIATIYKIEIQPDSENIIPKIFDSTEILLSFYSVRSDCMDKGFKDRKFKKRGSSVVIISTNWEVDTTSKPYKIHFKSHPFDFLQNEKIISLEKSPEGSPEYVSPREDAIHYRKLLISLDTTQSFQKKMRILKDLVTTRTFQEPEHGYDDYIKLLELNCPEFSDKQYVKARELHYYIDHENGNK